MVTHVGVLTPEQESALGADREGDRNRRRHVDATEEPAVSAGPQVTDGDAVGAIGESEGTIEVIAHGPILRQT